VNATPNSTSANIVWQGVTFGLVLSHYQLNVTYLGTCSDVNDTHLSIPVDGTASSYEVTNLLPNSAYSVMIVAVNARGRSDPANVSITTLTSGE